MRDWTKLFFLLICLVEAVFAAPALGQTDPFTAADMLAIVRISGDVSVSPTGDELAYILPDLADEWNVGARPQRGTVYVQRIGNGGIDRPVPVSPVGRWGSFPVFSPNGERLALYLEDAGGGRLAVWEARSGELRAVGERFTGKAWTPPVWVSDDVVLYARPAAAATAQAPARVQVLQSTDPTLPGDAYFKRERRSGLAVADLGGGSQRILLGDGERMTRFEMAPDARHVLAIVAGSEGRSGTFLWALGQSGDPRRIGSAGQRFGWMPDGRLYRREGGVLLVRSVDAYADEVIFEGLEDAMGAMIWAPVGPRFLTLVADTSLSDPEIERPQQGMYTIARPFTDLHIRSLETAGSINLTSNTTERIGNPVWSGDGAGVFFVGIDNATYDETLYRYDVPSGALSVLAQGRESYGALIPVPGGLLVSRQSATAPADLWLMDIDSGTWTRGTELNPELSRFSFSEPELFHFEMVDGDSLGALLYKPVNMDEEGGVPVVTYVYEKLTPGIHRFAARQQIFATHGYAVLMPNVKVKVGEPGTSFLEAVEPAVAAVRAMGFTNGRFCLWGGSFGAYATSYVITQTDVFSCAVSRATPPELFRNWASGRDRDSDNIESGQARMGGSPFEVMDRYLSQSAFFHLDQVETPVLIMHGVKDYTILYEEGAMMFYALRRLGKEATFVTYLEGDHSLYRHSREDALDVHRRMLDWFDKYLRGP